MKKSEIQDKLWNGGIYPDTLSIYKGVITCRWGFFYTMGRTAEGYSEQIKKIFSNAKIIDEGKVWKPFRGSATVAQGSHFYVKFKL